MNLNKLIEESLFFINQSALKKDDVLRLIAAKICGHRFLDAYGEEEIFKALRDREKAGSTGMGRGVAIPHCKLEKARDFVFGCVALEKGVDFGSADKSLCRLFFFIIGPESAVERHIKILSTLAGALQVPGLIEKMVRATDKGGLIRLVKESFDFEPGRLNEKPADSPEPWGRIEVIVQDEEKFEPILEIFSSLSTAGIVVFDGGNASYYLRNLPLFAAFWGGKGSSGFLKVVSATLKSARINAAIEQIYKTWPDIKKNKPSGLMITRTSLDYVAGSLEL